MTAPDVSLFLASASPRRRELLAQIGVPFQVAIADIDETPGLNEPPRAYVERLALAKARAVYMREAKPGGGLVVLGSDTCAVCDGEILGKPLDAADGQRMLTKLSGRWHQILTAVAVVGHQGVKVTTVEVRVRMKPLGQAEISRYWATGEPADKAGAYAIQGLGAVFVEGIEGSYSAVVGLPLCETAVLLQEFGVPIWQGAA